MPIISHMGVDYDSPNIQIQDNASATDLDNTKIPTGQTIESYVNNKTGGFSIRSVRYAIANNTNAQEFNYPSGFSNYLLIGAKIETRYNSSVDPLYGTDSPYFGDINYNTSSASKFSYKPKVAGNGLYVTFVFLCWNA